MDRRSWRTAALVVVAMLTWAAPASADHNPAGFQCANILGPNDLSATNPNVGSATDAVYNVAPGVDGQTLKTKMLTVTVELAAPPCFEKASYTVSVASTESPSDVTTWNLEGAWDPEAGLFTVHIPFDDPADLANKAGDPANDTDRVWISIESRKVVGQHNQIDRYPDGEARWCIPGPQAGGGAGKVGGPCPPAPGQFRH